VLFAFSAINENVTGIVDTKWGTNAITVIGAKKRT
jgi:hypothetical protein